MGWLRYFRRRLWDQERSQELDAYLEQETADNIARGMPVNTAREVARRKLGNPTLVREDIYRMNTASFLETPWQDLRFAARQLRKSPGFTAAAVLTLALGLGANTAIFSMVDAVLLKPLPYADPDKLLAIWEKNSAGNRNMVAALTYLDWRDQVTSVDLAIASGNWLTMTGQGDPWKVQARVVSTNYFDLVGTPLALGRSFRPEEGLPGSERVVIVSHRFWQERLGLDTNILGKTLTLDGLPYNVIGTLPANGLYDRHTADIWIPQAITRGNTNRAFRYLQVFGRLHPGATRASVQAEMDGVAGRLAQLYPDTNKGGGVIVDSLADRAVAQSLRQSLYVLFAAVGAIVLIACVNLANLLLARGAARDHEFQVRMALGAGRVRLVRQLLTESILLSLLGGATGAALGSLLLSGLMAWIPQGTLPFFADVRLDWSVLGYLFALAIVSGMLFGLAPAIAVWRRDVGAGLRSGPRGSSGGVAGGRLRSVLIGAEVALTFVLASTAGIVIHSFARLTGVDTGVNMTNVVGLQLPRSMDRDTSGARETRLMNDIRDSVAAVPGVKNAAITSSMPLQGIGFGMGFTIEGASSSHIPRNAGTGLKQVSPEYFDALGMKVKLGRNLAHRDAANALPVCVVNDSFVKEFLGHDNPIGQRVLIGRIITGKREFGAPIPWEIVGVVSDEKQRSLDADTVPEAYVNFDQSPIVGVGLIVRAQGDPLLLKKSIESAIWNVRRDQAVTDYQTLEQIKEQSTANSRYNTALLAAFAGIALILAAIGIYGVVAYSVTQRTRELGIRAALGASRRQLLVLALRNSVIVTSIALILGAIGMRWAGKLVESMLFNTQPVELSTLVAVAAILMFVSLIASLVPARRAARIDPIIALRQD
jgi:putative ABC transport system permease protein